MKSKTPPCIAKALGSIPNRLQLAGGWIDQPFISRHNPKPTGASLNLNMKCWETLLPHVVRHPLIRLDLMALLKAYQRQYPGAMYSGCGGGYLIVVSNEPVPGAFKVNVRVAQK